MSPCQEVSTIHREVCERIPWVINGTATPADGRRVALHVAECAECRAELEFQQRLRDGIAAQPGVAPDVEASLRRFWAGAAPAPLPSAAPAKRRAVSSRAWTALVAAVAIEGVAVCALGLALLLRTPPPDYRTLALPEAAPEATLRVVFAPEMTAQAIRDALRQSHLRIVAGPSDAGAFSLAPDAGDAGSDPARALTILRGIDGVVFAEPVADRPAAR